MILIVLLHAEIVDLQFAYTLAKVIFLVYVG